MSHTTLLTMYKFRIESEIQHLFPSITKALDASGIAYFLKNEDLEFIHANKNFLNILLYDEVVGNTDFDLFIPDIAFEQRQIEEQLLVSGLEQTNESVIIGLNKVEKVLSITRSVYTEGGKRFIIGIAQDITELKQQEQFKAYKQVLTKEEMYEKVLNRFSSYIFNNNDEQIILDGVSKLCIDLLKLEDISVFLFDRQANCLLERAFLGKNNKIEYEAHNPLMLEIGQGIVGAAAETKQTVLINNLSEDARYIKGATMGMSELAVPIMYRGKFIGVIDTEHSAVNYFTQRDVQILEGIANLLAIKLHEVHNYKLLEERNKELHAFVMDSPVAISILDTRYNYLACSKPWVKSARLQSENDLVGKNHFDVFSNTPAKWKAKFRKAMKGQVQNITKEFYPFNNKEGEWFNARISPWKKNNGEIGGVVMYIEIITEQIIKEHHFNNTYNQLKEARKLGKLFTWEFNPNSGKFKWSAGSNVQKISATNLEEIGTLFEVVDPDYKQEFNRVLGNAIKEKSDFQLIHPIILNGIKYWVSTRGKVESNEEGIARVYGTAQDITHQIETEENLKRKNEELQKINAELDQFVYKTAHDLRAPLTNLIGLISVMRNETNTDLLNTYFDLQEKSVEKMDAFIHTITDFTKNSRMPVQIEKLNFNLMMDEVFNEYLFYDKSEIIQKNFSIQAGKEMYSDPMRIKSILSNLISNAIKFSDISKSNPFISIEVSTHNTDIIIRVSDNGMGINKNSIPKVFDMFYRGHKSSEGAGIGLYIVNETVHKLNGKISLTSVEHNGTEIEIVLPNLNPKLS